MKSVMICRCQASITLIVKMMKVVQFTTRNTVMYSSFFHPHIYNNRNKRNTWYREEHNLVN